MAETPQDKSNREFEELEQKRRNQVEFDAKVHGVGTVPPSTPAHAKEMWEKYVVPLIAKVAEQDIRLAAVEAKVARMKPAQPKPLEEDTIQ